MGFVVRLSLIIVFTGWSAVANAGASIGHDALPAQGNSSGSERTLVETLYDRSGSIFMFACTADGEPLPIDEGEPVAIEGQVFERLMFVTDAAGGLHYTLKTMPVGLRGVGLISGEEFRVVENQKQMSNQKIDKLTGTFWLAFNGNYSISADGVVKSERNVERILCGVQG
jgi:hypothetical protein